MIRRPEIAEAMLGVIGAVVLGAALFSTFSLIVACILKTRERFMGIGQVLTMPLFFASNAIYPISIMPPWLRAVALWNPLTYEVDALRTLMLYGQKSTYGLGVDFAVLAGVTALLIFVAGRLYPRVAT
jgi:ABC-2 type transport system permease protein